MKYINFKIEDLEIKGEELSKKYLSADPFQHIVIDNFFYKDILDSIIDNFPKSSNDFNNNFNKKSEKKLSLNQTDKFSDTTNNFINFLNSSLFIKFLQKLTSIKETLIPDPYLLGGGLHELRNGGYLNIHSDFNRHPKMKLDRRLNLLIYLNKDWKNSFGGQLELWNKDMTKCCQSIIPEFNRMVVFSTNSFSYHGNPNKIDCPSNLTRKSLALYYYSNGRPEHELDLGDHTTIFRKRPGSEDEDTSVRFKRLFGKFYVKKKGS